MTCPEFSIVIPVHRDGDAFRRCLAACARLSFSSYEILVVSDRLLDGLPEGVTLVETRSSRDTSPAEKRDLAFSATAGNVLAFLDDDACPSPDWLTNASRHFSRREVKALGGPGLTPPDSPWLERLGGAVYESLAGSGPLRRRFVPTSSPCWVDDHPAYNLFVRRDALAEVGGWGTSYYGGEDTVLCLKLARRGVRILYAPDIVVFHRRRPVLLPHLRQVANVGRHRGYFVRAYPDNSRRIVYFLPVLVPVVGLAVGLLFRSRPAAAGGAMAAGYLAVAAESLRRHPFPVAAAVPFAVALHHLAYGAAFVRGLLGGRLEK